MFGSQNDYVLLWKILFHFQNYSKQILITCDHNHCCNKYKFNEKSKLRKSNSL